MCVVSPPSRKPLSIRRTYGAPVTCRRSNHRTGPVPLWLVGLWGLLVTVLAGTRPVTGDDAAVEPRVYRTEIVDASDRSSWPAGDWIPLSVDRWKRFEAAGGAPAEGEAEVYVESARYQARLDGEALADGTLEASIRNVSGFETFLDLGHTSLAVSEATMDGAPAVWGADPQGRVRLQVNGPSA